jgi:hypothetical protein
LHRGYASARHGSIPFSPPNFGLGGAPVGPLTPDEARRLAKATLGSVAHGLDPAAVKAAERRASTLREIADLFLSEHAEAKRKPLTASSYRDVLQRLVLPELGNRRAEKVATADLARLHVRMKDRPYQANRLIAVVGSLYAFAGKRKLVPAGFNPARGIDRYPEKGRERFLTCDELARLGDAIREAETEGLPWTVDQAKPTAKHAPKEANRRTVLDPFAAAAQPELAPRQNADRRQPAAQGHGHAAPPCFVS